MGRTRIVTIVALWGITASVSAGAQVIEYSAGASSLLRARGGSALVHGDAYSARVGVGFLDTRPTPLVGWSLATTWRGSRWELGDQSIPLTFPTDQPGGSFRFQARGLAVGRTTSRSELFLFGGATATGFSAPYFQSSDARTPAGLVYYDRQIAASLRGYSRNVVSTRRTSIHGMRWSPRRGAQVGLAGGIGSNQPFGSGSLEFDSRRVVLRAAYTRAGDEFRRLPAEGVTVSESDRENLRLELRPHGSLRLGLSRQHYSALVRGSALRSTVNGASAGGTVAGIRANGSALRSGSSRGYSLGASRSIVRGFEVEGAYFRSEHSGVPAHETFVSHLRESFGPRFGLSQVVSTGNGSTSVSWGGHLRTSRVFVSVDYQTTFLPFAPAGRSSFQQVAMLQVRVPLPGALRLEATTHVDPVGQLRYTVYTTGFAYGRPIASRSAGPRRDAIAANVILGTVVDTAGAPVSGAALRVDGDLVFSDSRGRIEVRKSKAGEYAVEVALEEFMFPGTYEVVAVPAIVRAGAEKDAREFRVVLRRAR